MSMCRVFSCVVEREYLLWPVRSLDRSWLAFALLHSVFQGQICLLLCRCQPAKSIRSRERARWGWERKLKQEKSTTKMGLRGSDTSPRRDAVWHQLYSASHIYTEEREKDKTVNIFFLVDLYILQTVTRNLESMWNGTLLLFLTPDNISLCVRSLSRTPGVCSK